ncbi:molybdenum cofactor synthesis domain-containing protein [Niveomyces insectorum RCEF 264]|uniref:Molybdenum cofactor synthesis domain-containing protein n=1 Tax=Niveomyces insectorum RCEF 264 TaxID=1081102 RepID=A0A167QYV9_9HYPO|nr:molybdenum cofactor synthesis domain-containing protein [Niveomyces insectorum RCEF 264]
MSLRLAQVLRHLSGPSSPCLRAASPVSVSALAAGAVYPPISTGFPGTHPATSALAARSAPFSTMADTATAQRNVTRPIHTAACLIIGDEVLGGKTKDTNSAYMAKFCFSLGVNLKRVEVIEDDEEQIVEAVRRMSDRYDFVVTSGGIGPTSPSPVVDWDDAASPALRARLRMVELPTDPARPPEEQFLFPRPDLWVPVCVANGNVHILPGVPRLFEMLLDGLKPVLLPRLAGTGIERVLVSTPLPESVVAPYLTELAARVEPRGVKVGSYPRWERKRNTITLVGRDQALLESLVPEVVANVQGRRIAVEGEDDESDGEKEEAKAAAAAEVKAQAGLEAKGEAKTEP